MTKTLSPANFFAVNVSATTTVANNPSGTLATIIPIAKIKLVTAAKNIINNIYDIRQQNLRQKR